MAGRSLAVEKVITSRRYFIGGSVVSVFVTVITWTSLRPYLVITDGVDTATDPFTPFGVCLVNAVLVLVGWLAWTLVFLLGRGVHRAVSSRRSSRAGAR